MKCLIPGRFVKLFGRAIHCLSKIGDELYLEASEDGLALRTVNSSRSAFGCFLFNESFFHEFNIKISNSNGSKEDEEVERFKISMKSCLGVFKSLNTIEKNVDTCRLEYDEKNSRIVFQLFCKHGIVKTHNLTFQESESLQAVFSKDLCPNLIITSAKVLIDTAANFPNSCEEVTFCCTPESLTIKNYIEDEPDPSKIVHTEMRLHPGEFENYRIGVDADITFCLKEARAILAFSDFAAQPVNIHFAAPGKPVVFSLDGDSLYLADFVLATLMEHSISSQGSQPAEATMERAANTIKPRPTKIKKGAGSHKSSKDAKKALEESDIPVEVTCDEDALNAVDLRSLSTPPYNANKTARKGSEHNTESHGNEEDDFFSESFPYKDMLKKNKAHSSEASEHQSGYGEDPVLQVKGYVDSQNKSVLSADVSLPFVGNSVTPQNEMPKTNFDVCDDVLPSTPPSKKFKSIFFGTVTSPAEIRKRRKLHETVLAEDTDDENGP
ncbi:cell cycle checkpoint control protein RAD9A-like [Rhopilema esculentum]|uniref:cell cycle checkpoint control protein RAD9A-like n=1 Tax=Rhopilema esculentum TaxID=499914 RepID=UPI0031D1FAC7